MSASTIAQSRQLWKQLMTPRFAKMVGVTVTTRKQTRHVQSHTCSVRKRDLAKRTDRSPQTTGASGWGYGAHFPSALANNGDLEVKV